MKIAIKTLGCKSNRYESDKLFEKLSTRHVVFELNEGITTFQRRISSDYDIAVVNTCTVTHGADRKSRQAIRSLKHANPSCHLIVFGCGSNVAKDRYLSMAEADTVVGTADEVVRFIGALGKSLAVEQAARTDMLPYKGSPNNGTRTRAVVKIQDGCNNYCAYCIIPRARGQEISYGKEAILEEVKSKEAGGFREVVLTGIIISNWKSGRMDFADLVWYLIENTFSVRFRISSIEPQNFSKKFVRLFQHDRVCPHVHMSLQSGSDSVLQRMKRRYDTSLYAGVCRELREAVSDIGLTTDVIVGFPGETDDEFKETCDFVRDIGFLKTHIFPYSRRKNTAAYYMENQVGAGVKKLRTQILRKISDESRKAFLDGVMGKNYDVIVEKRVNDICFGLTPNYIPVQFSCSGDEMRSFAGNVDDPIVGRVFRVKLKESTNGNSVRALIV